MSSFGVVPAGFRLKTREEIKEAIEEKQRATISPGANQSATGAIGRMNAPTLDELAELWEVAEDLYNANDPDAATGEALDMICRQSAGLTRLGATKATATLTVTGTPTTVLPAGRVVSVDGNASAKFATLEEVTIASLTAWASTTGYTLGQVRTNAGRVYVCITAGTSAGSGGPSTTADDITDGSVHWRYLGEGAGAVDVEVEAQTEGLLAVASGTLTEIDTPVSGWDSAINILDATPGTDRETDSALRARRELVLQAAGSSTTDAIRADVLRVSGVTECVVFENYTDVTDGDGVPPHAIEVVARGGEDNDIAQAIWNNRAGGIRAYGSSSGDAVDALGETRTVEFSRPSLVDVYLVVDVKIDASKFPSDGDAQIKAALVAYGDALAIGADVISSAQYAAIFSVSGVVDVVAVKQGTAPAPSSTTTLTIDSREVADFDSSRITVNHV